MNVFYIHQAHLSHSRSTHFKGQSPHLTTPQYPPDPILVTDNTIIFVSLSQSIALSATSPSPKLYCRSFPHNGHSNSLPICPGDRQYKVQLLHTSLKQCSLLSSLSNVGAVRKENPQVATRRYLSPQVRPVSGQKLLAAHLHAHVEHNPTPLPLLFIPQFAVLLHTTRQNPSQRLRERGRDNIAGTLCNQLLARNCLLVSSSLNALGL